MAAHRDLPLLLGAGTAIDYSVGMLNQKALQSMLDSSVWAGASNWAPADGAATMPPRPISLPMSPAS